MSELSLSGPAAESLSKRSAWLKSLFRLGGPLFWYDLARLARRGRTALLRCTYALFLFAWMSLAVHQQFPQYVTFSKPFAEGPRLSVSARANLAERFGWALLALQGVAVFVLTPAYIATAVADEREQQTLDLLFTTPLTNRDIILGKLFGRVGHLINVLLVGVPILSLTFLWGGVDARALVADLAVTGLTLLSVGAISMFCSVVASNSFRAVVSSYAVVVAFGALCLVLRGSSPINFMALFDVEFGLQLERWNRQVTGMTSPGGTPLSPAALAALYPRPSPLTVLIPFLFTASIVHGLVFFLFIRSALTLLRPAVRLKKRHGRSVRSTRALDPASWGPFETHVMPGLYQVHTRRRSYVPTGDDALLWKELWRSRTNDQAARPLDELREHRLWALGLLAGLAVLSTLCQWRQPALQSAVIGVLNPVVRVVTIAAAGLGCIGVAFRAASSVSRERDQRTLESLLLLPVTRGRILGAKWLGSVLRFRQVGYALIAVWTPALACGVIHPWAVPLLAATCVVYVILLASLGIWLSLVARNTRWANLSMAAVVLLLFGTRWITSRLFEAEDSFRRQSDLLYSILEFAFNPVRAWWFAGFTWGEGTEGLVSEHLFFLEKLAGLVLGLVVCLIVAGLFWGLACWRLQRLPERAAR
jgi:ABC-type transport system involved in multi-copper enzyme maturation permease subunit